MVTTLDIRPERSVSVMPMARENSLNPDSLQPFQLSWPDYFTQASKFQIWLAKFGLSELPKKAKDDLQQQLEKRDESTRTLWPREAGLLALCEKAFPRIAEWMQWPNTYFVPSDPCEIIFWNPGPTCSFEGLVFELSDILAVPRKTFDAPNMQGKTLEEFMKDLLSLGRE